MLWILDFEQLLIRKLTYHVVEHLGPVYTWRTFTGVKLNNNWTQNSRPAIFWQCNQDTEPEGTALSVKFSDYVYFQEITIYSFCSVYERKIEYLRK